MAKIGMQGNPPTVKVGTQAFKRPEEYYVHDIRSTLGRLNVQLAKCHQIRVGITLRLDVSPNGEQSVVLVSAVLP